MAGVYIHVPFCKQACSYCDFHFSTQRERQQEVVEAMQKEIVMRQSYLCEVPVTLYFGGGTPSLLTEGQLQLLTDSATKFLRLVPGGEVTLEANPEDLSVEKLRAFRGAGVNRLSIGVQSFHPSILSLLNRSHDANTSLEAFQQARNEGFENLSMDLIYAIPGQSADDLRTNIEMAIRMRPEHISAYALTIEPKTVFGAWQTKGKFSAVPEDAAVEEMNLLIDLLEDAGYEHYEVSNFCRPGYRAGHNSSYWQQLPYIGIGPSAHSYDGDSRQFNVANNTLYVNALRQDQLPFTREVLSRADKINEYLLTSLRTKEGADLRVMEQQFDHSLIDRHSGYLERLIERRLARLEDEKLTLTRQGIFLADKIASDLFEVTDDE